jgi:magnesium chelatase subunit I
LPSITGKIELEDEGELQGAETVGHDLLTRAAGGTFDARAGGADCEEIVGWFEEGGALKVAPDERAELCLQGFSAVAGILDLVHNLGLVPKGDPATTVAACELVLEGLVTQKRISRSEEFGYSRVRPRRHPTEDAGGPEIAY